MDMKNRFFNPFLTLFSPTDVLMHLFIYFCRGIKGFDELFPPEIRLTTSALCVCNGGACDKKPRDKKRKKA